MKVREWSRRFHISRHRACIATIGVLLCMVAVGHLSNSRLKAQVDRFQEGQAALLRERVDLKWTADAWKKEAVEWREKNGYVEPPITAALPDDENREPLLAPSP